MLPDSELGLLQTRRLDAEGRVVCRLPPGAPALEDAGPAPNPAAEPLSPPRQTWLAQLIRAADNIAAA